MIPCQMTIHLEVVEAVEAVGLFSDESEDDNDDGIFGTSSKPASQKIPAPRKPAGGSLFSDSMTLMVLWRWRSL